MKTWVFQEKQTDRKGGDRGERKRRGVQPSRTCLVLFHQPSLWKLASSSPPFPSLTSSLPFACKEAIREGERGRDRERGAVTLTELSEALWGNKQHNLLCFSTSFPCLAHSLLFSSVFFRRQNDLYSECMLLCVHVVGLRQATLT